MSKDNRCNTCKNYGWPEGTFVCPEDNIICAGSKEFIPTPEPTPTPTLVLVGKIGPGRIAGLEATIQTNGYTIRTQGNDDTLDIAMRAAAQHYATAVAS